MSVGTNTVTFAYNISKNFVSETDQDAYSTYITTGMKTLQVAAYYDNGTLKYEDQGIFDATVKTPVTGGASSMAVFGAAVTALAAFAFWNHTLTVYRFPFAVFDLDLTHLNE